jgi:hypothetical protein
MDRPTKREELDMKIKSKVRAGRDCGGGPPPKDGGPIVI